ncbi:MAG: hypothetical protein GX211_02780 [Clostridiaceae bacterium]|nr:hypothetical protein [Clostridiaceae bacterium]
MRKNIVTRQFIITPEAGKRLIAKAFVYIPEILRALKNHTIVVVAGTTNGYVARELLNHIEQSDGFKSEHFYRGITLPPRYSSDNTEKPDSETQFPGDVVIEKGIWLKGKTIFDVSKNLDKGDIIIKGANAVDMINRKAAVLIGHSEGGTVMAAISAVIGKRAVLYIPVGLEKRVPGNLDLIAAKVNSPNSSGPRLFPISGNIITELDAIRIITGAEAEIIAAGGVHGAEGCCYVAVSGGEDQVENAAEIIKSAYIEPAG